MKKNKRDFTEIEDSLKKLRHTFGNIADNANNDLNTERSVMSDDISSEAQVSEQLEVTSAIANHSTQRILEVEQALERMANGTYGACEECEQDIPLARLEVLPYTTHCMKCQKLIETGKLIKD